MNPTNQSSSGTTPARRVRPAAWVTAALLLAAAIGAWLHFRPASRPGVAAPPELTRHELVFTNGLNFRRGDTNPFTGFLTEHYAAGGPRSRSALSNGLLHGLSQGWHTNGQLQVEEHFAGGVSHGPRTRWFADGTKESEATIVRGTIEGVFRKWHPNGALAQEISMSNGVPHGVSRAFAPDGALKNEVSLSNGVIARDSAPL